MDPNQTVFIRPFFILLFCKQKPNVFICSSNRTGQNHEARRSRATEQHHTGPPQRVHVPDPSAGLGSVQHAADVLLEITRLICEQFSPLRRTEESDPAQTRVLFLCGCFRGTDPEPEPEPEQFL